jgi:3-(3-hydroxy-phenyl)propionate hydroxylase
VRVEGRDGWFLGQTGMSFVAVLFSDNGDLAPDAASALGALARAEIPVRPVVVVPKGVTAKLPGVSVVEDAQGMLAQRFDARDGTCYLLRPDQHVCARWRRFDPGWVKAAVARATCNA